MKHLFKVSVVTPLEVQKQRPQSADAKTDFLNAVYNAWSDFIYQKKNELSL